MDLNAAIQYGCCVKAAEDITPTDLTNRAGQAMPIGAPGNQVNYKVVATVYGNDLVTPKNAVAANQFVSFGLVLQDPTGSVVIAIRGTEGIIEWLQDADFPLSL
jgi:hypothetical protein